MDKREKLKQLLDDVPLAELIMAHLEPYIETPEKIAELSIDDKTTPYVLSYLFKVFPEYISFFRLWDQLSEDDWRFVIDANPKIAEYCTKWQNFSADTWAQLLLSLPADYENMCHCWDQFTEYQWNWLLCEHPQYFKHYSTLTFDTVYDPRRLTSFSWCSILQTQPSLLKDCPCLDEFDFSLWSRLLQKQPLLANHCPWNLGVDKSCAQAWIELITVQPQFASKLDWNIGQSCTNGLSWAKLLKGAPQYVVYCPWEKLEPLEWMPLFKYVPEYAEKCSCWEELPIRAWGYLLAQRPEFASRFTRWQEIPAEIWASLLSRQSIFADRCNCWEQFTAECWFEILQNNPQFSDKCHQWENFSKTELEVLLHAHPELQVNSEFQMMYHKKTPQDDLETLKVALARSSTEELLHFYNQQEEYDFDSDYKRAKREQDIQALEDGVARFNESLAKWTQLCQKLDENGK